MFEFTKKCFFTVIMFFGYNINPLKRVSMNNQEYKVRPEVININSNESLFYP